MYQNTISNPPEVICEVVSLANSLWELVALGT
jgi:hypothetical protein